MKKILLIIILIVPVLLSCDKGEISTITNVCPLKSINQNTEDFARLLSASLLNPKMKEYLLNEITEKFDGDNNFLISVQLDDRLTRGSDSFYTLLHSGCLTKSLDFEEYDIDSILDYIKTEDPLLQIYIMNEELWNMGYDPIILCLPEEYDENCVCEFICFDDNGDKFIMSSTEDIDDIPVIIISRNERTIAIENKNLGPDASYMGAAPFYSNENYSYFLKDELIIEDEIIATYIIPSTKSNEVYEIELLSDEEVAEIMGTSYVNCHRMKNYQTKDFIGTITMSNKDAWTAIESGVTGDPELRLYVIYAERTEVGVNIKLHTEYLSGNHFKNRNNIATYTWDNDIMQWSLANNGNSMSYVWFEEDNSSDTKTLMAPYSIKVYVNETIVTYNGNCNINVGKKDVSAGNSFVYYTDPQNSMYNTSYVKFTIDARTGTEVN